ncbi:hypothetical protein KOR34_04960 [Posidoniimonas corsicana]|uniref:Uncharacterized protein n=1 Tax=Posidoniimonas corsicana TaxID=1938618 RepID=A0A5C5VCB4_9BACT|nr:DUF1580 domain-containing protein [Posidoniimonas corsicana]TWT35603.1 hypothetical protein KOR34_04960 [Posidoniimonas corsicana]
MPILEEELGPLVDRVEKVCRKRHHYSTAFRWTQRGLLTPDGRRVRLEYVKAGAERLTSVEAVRRFFAATTGATAPVVTPQTSRQREAALARAEAECESLGI